MPPLADIVGTGLDILNLGAFGFIAFYFASGRIFSNRQVERMLTQADKAHAAEVANLNRFHDTLVGVKEGAYADMKQSRDDERRRADEATTVLGEFADVVKLNTHVLASFDEAAKGGTP
jgi:hypothetical protein